MISNARTAPKRVLSIRPQPVNRYRNATFGLRLFIPLIADIILRGRKRREGPIRDIAAPERLRGQRSADCSGATIQNGTESQHWPPPRRSTTPK
jgi:hypothetical protein